jgi:hypothetical protein
MSGSITNRTLGITSIYSIGNKVIQDRTANSAIVIITILRFSVCFFSKTGPLTSERVERFRTANKSWWIAVVTRPIRRIACAITSPGAKVTCAGAGRFLGLGSTSNKTLQESHVRERHRAKDRQIRSRMAGAVNA